MSSPLERKKEPSELLPKSEEKKGTCVGTVLPLIGFLVGSGVLVYAALALRFPKKYDFLPEFGHKNILYISAISLSGIGGVFIIIWKCCKSPVEEISEEKKKEDKESKPFPKKFEPRKDGHISIIKEADRKAFEEKKLEEKNGFFRGYVWEVKKKPAEMDECSFFLQELEKDLTSQQNKYRDETNAWVIDPKTKHKLSYQQARDNSKKIEDAIATQLKLFKDVAKLKELWPDQDALYTMVMEPVVEHIFLYFKSIPQEAML